MFRSEATRIRFHSLWTEREELTSLYNNRKNIYWQARRAYAALSELERTLGAAASMMPCRIPVEFIGTARLSAQVVLDNLNAMDTFLNNEFGTNFGLTRETTVQSAPTELERLGLASQQVPE